MEIGLKVITANQATIAPVFKHLKVNPKNNAVGALFKRTNFIGWINIRKI